LNVIKLLFNFLKKYILFWLAGLDIYFIDSHRQYN
jgi:hypothetical protein